MFGFGDKQLPYYHLEVGKPNPSAYDEFPHRYRFIAFQIFMSNDRSTMKRVSMSVPEYFATLGGLAKFLYLLCPLIVAFFGHVRLNYFLLKSLYKEHSPTEEEAIREDP